MSETSEQPKMQLLNQNPHFKTTIPLRVVGVVLAILFALRGRMIEAVVQFLMMATVPLTDHWGGAAFSIVWHALAFIVYSSQSAVSLYNKYNLVDSNNTSALSKDTVVTNEILPSDYVYPIVSVFLLGAMLLMLHVTITNMLVRRRTEEALSGKKATYVIHDAGVVFGATISTCAFQMIALTKQGVWNTIFMSLGNAELILFMAHALLRNRNQFFQLFHCFYLLAVGSFLLFSYSAVESKSLESTPLTVMMSAPWLDGVRNFLGHFSYAGVYAAVIFWCMRLNWNYLFTLYTVVSRRVRNNLLLKDSIHSS